MLLFLVCFIVSASALLVYLRASQAPPASMTAQDLLIVAAHSDDCVIMGAEMAWGILRDGGHVHIAYMTCSGPDSSAPIAQQRAQEARTAWQQEFGDQVTFADANLPQSEIGGPANYSDEDLARFVDMLSRSVTDLSEQAIVLIPAAQELHIDHDNARLAAIRAVAASGRRDIRLIETAEYNEVISMRHDPIGVVFHIFAEFPILRGLLPKRCVSPPFFGGPPGQMYSDTPARLDAKISMLGAFASQDPAVLRDHFSWPSKYRPVWRNQSASSFRIMNKTADLGALLFVVSLLSVIATLSFALADDDFAIVSLEFLFGAALLVGATVKKKWIPGLVGFAIIAGIVAAAFAL